MSERRRAIVAGLGILAAFLTGYFGAWMVDAVTGTATQVEINRCYKDYNRLEEELYHCDGYWSRPRQASGPVVGVPIDVGRAELVDPSTRLELGYEIRRESYAQSVFAVIRGDGAVVVPPANLVLGPASLAATVACAVVLLTPVWRRRPDEVRTGQG